MYKLHSLMACVALKTKNVIIIIIRNVLTWIVSAPLKTDDGTAHELPDLVHLHEGGNSTPHAAGPCPTGQHIRNNIRRLYSIYNLEHELYSHISQMHNIRRLYSTNNLEHELLQSHVSDACKMKPLSHSPQADMSATTSNARTA